MQKTAILALGALLLTTQDINAQVRRTSLDLSREEVLPTVAVSAPLMPVGHISFFLSNTPPQDAEKWLECNGQAIPAGAKYNRLRAMLSSNHVPDLSNGPFLRPTTDSSKTGVTVADSIKTHNIDVPGQSATVTANLDNTDVHGVASAQGYSYQTTTETFGAFLAGAENGVVIAAPWGNDHGVAHSTTTGGTIAGNVSNGHVTGVANVQSTTGVYSGASETAPLHIYVKTYIRAVQ